MSPGRCEGIRSLQTGSPWDGGHCPVKDISKDSFKIHQSWEDGPSGGKQVHGAGNCTDCLGNGDGVRNQVRSLRCEEWQRNQKKWSGVRSHYFREFDFIYGQRDAQEGFRAGRAVIRSMLLLKVLLRLNFSMNLGAFERWCWRRLLRVSWAARRSNQSILKIINPEYSLEGLILKDWGQDEKGERGWDGIRDSMDMNLRKFWDSEGERSLVCGSPWGCKESDMT